MQLLLRETDKIDINDLYLCSPKDMNRVNFNI